MSARLAQLLSFAFLLLVPPPIILSAADLTLGSSLSPDDGRSWTNGAFAAGFRSIAPQEYGFAIWYDGIPEQTIVWLANADRPVNRNGSLNLTTEGDLLLRDAVGNTVWSSNTSKAGVANASLASDGNLVLLNKSGAIVWQSFDTPTTTLLPNQVLKETASLTSNRSSNNASSGPYQFFVDATGSLSLSYNGRGNVYWSSGTSPSPNVTGSAAYAELDSSGTLIAYAVEGSPTIKYNASDFSTSRVLRRLTLDTDGNLRTYSWDANSWVVVWEALSQQCDVYGLCGPNGLCSYYPNVACTCPTGFHVVNKNDWSQGCALDVPLTLNCSSAADPSSSIKLIRLQNTDFPTNDIHNSTGLTEQSCTQACLNNCSCVGVSYTADGTGACRLKSHLSNGVQSPDSSSTMFLKVSVSDRSATSPPAFPSVVNLSCPPFTQPTADQQGSNHRSPGIAVICITSFTELVCFLMAGCFLREMYSRQHLSSQKNSSEMLLGILTIFTYKELELATNNFHERLGTGGFGSVYKGVLPTQRQVAVKKLEGVVSHGEKEFRTEVAMIGKIHHMNLMPLMGFCAEGEHRLLVYEYMPNGSLDKFLFGSPDESTNLNWEVRFGIALGTARAITYLHEECHDWILHCDIKPHNILLDEHLCPKVSDFGLAKLLDRQHPLSVSAIRGTRGYLAPEWVGNRAITAKADVYSFGMVLLEIVSGRSNYELTPDSLKSDEEWNFPQWAYQQMKAGRLEEAVVDPKLEGRVERMQVETVMKVAFSCIRIEAGLRPSMGEVVQMLEGTIPVADPPMPRFLGDFSTGQSSSSTISIHQREISM